MRNMQNLDWKGNQNIRHLDFINDFNNFLYIMYLYKILASTPLKNKTSQAQK